MPTPARGYPSPPPKMQPLPRRKLPTGPAEPRRQGGELMAEPDPLATALADLAAAIRELAAVLKTTPGAKTVTTQVRHTPEHRNPNARSNFGFAPVKAEES